MTIVGGVMAGLRPKQAAEFSFLLGLLTLLAASVYEGWAAREALASAYSPMVMAAGFVAAFVSAVLSMRFLVAWVRERGLGLFGWYRVALGLGVLYWLGAFG